MTSQIPEPLRRQVAQRANHRCEYCLMPERFLATYFHIDHIRSMQHGGTSDAENLAFACPHCNQHKGPNVGTFSDDDQSGETLIRFFNPRRDRWSDHFDVIQGEIIARSTIGRATASIFAFNQPERLILRRELAAIGQYPG